MTNNTHNTNNNLPLISQYVEGVTTNPVPSPSFLKQLTKPVEVIATPLGKYGNPTLIPQLLALPPDTRISSVTLDDVFNVRHRVIVDIIMEHKPFLSRYGDVHVRLVKVPAHRDTFGVHIHEKEQTVVYLLPEQVAHLALVLSHQDELLTQFSVVRELFQI